MTNITPPSGRGDQSPLYTDTVRHTGQPLGLDDTVAMDVSDVPVGSTSESGSTTPPGGQSGTASSAKDAASNVGHSVKDAGSEVAGTATEEAKRVASEAKSQAKNLLDQTRSEVGEQAATQQKRVAQGLRSVGDELHGMSSSSDSSGLASELVGQAAERIQGFASWLDDREPGSVLQELRSFAARRPGVFIGVAAAAGLIAGRLTKGLVAEAKDDRESSSATPRTDADSEEIHDVRAVRTTPITPQPTVGSPLDDTALPSGEYR